jgi:hypothetical protein
MTDETKTEAKPAATDTAERPSTIPQDEIARLTDEIVGALKTVYDPEIPADICLPSRRRRRTLEICHQEFIGTFSLPLVRLYSRRVNRR